jgi:hypothetical protein
MNNNMDNVDRVKILRMSYRDVLENLASGNYRMFTKAISLPDEYKVLSVHQDVRSREFIFLIYHPEFDIVEAHIEPPEIESIYFSCKEYDTSEMVDWV